ncbi:MAG TPA: MFS transporter [Polyangiaceae bacterium]|nr:MFS transporter [Polyangiaceae bacterium]
MPSSPAAQSSVTIAGLRWYICALLFLVTFINYVDRVSLGALAPLLQQSIGWDDAEFGWINFCFALAYAAMFPVAGRLIDRFGVKAGLALGVGLWSVASMAHALASSVLGFAAARFLLGIGEATNFPACIKAVAEWFPKRQRSLATGLFNTGTNFAAMAQGGMLIVATMVSWRAVFLVVGVLGFAWLAVWLVFYRAPEQHPNLAAAELELIRDGEDELARSAVVRIPWPVLLRHREAWAFLVAKMLTDPVWWFYLTWLPTYLKRERDISLASAAGTLAIIYLAADVGSIVGGWVPGRLMRAGWEPGRARLTALLFCALGLPISALASLAHELWLTVLLISVATASHQAWSANLFTVASDTFPKPAVASVVGFGAMCGGIGGLFMNLIAGGMLQWLGTYTPLFVFAGLMHPLAWLLLRFLVRGELKQVTLATEGRQTPGSPVLRWFGVSLLTGGAALGGLVVLSWQAILEATRHSVAAAAGGVAAAVLIGLMGLALVYASREQPLAAV